MKTEQFIPVNRRKMQVMTVVYSCIGIIAFLGIFYWGEYQNFANENIFNIAAFIVLFFFLVIAGTYAKNARNKSAGITLNATGMTDETSSIAIGLIKWKEITGFSKVKTTGSSLFLFNVKQPKKVIERAPNAAVKRLLTQNQTIYKTPVVIKAGILKQNTDELEALFLEYIRKYTQINDL